MFGFLTSTDYRESERKRDTERERTERERGGQREREEERERERILFTVYPRFLYFWGIGIPFAEPNNQENLQGDRKFDIVLSNKKDEKNMYNVKLK